MGPYRPNTTPYQPPSKNILENEEAPQQFMQEMTHIPILPSNMTKPMLHNGAIVYTPIHPTFKQYNIGVPEPGGDHQLISRIYQDIIPEDIKAISKDFSSVSLRLETYDVIRANILGAKDGIDIDVSKRITDNSQDFFRSGTKQYCKNLMSKVKLFDLNPYKKTANAYEDLPDRMLLYRTAYPLEYTNRKLSHNTEGVSINARMYDLTMAEYQYDSIEGLSWNYFNVWREMKYYEYIRNNVINVMESPNFVLMYGYFISLNSNIPFDKIKKTKSKIDQHRCVIREEEFSIIIKNKQLKEIIQRIYNTHIVTIDADKRKQLNKKFENILMYAYKPSTQISTQVLENIRSFLAERIQILKNEYTKIDEKMESQVYGAMVMNQLDKYLNPEGREYKKNEKGDIVYGAHVVKKEDCELDTLKQQLDLLEKLLNAVMTNSCNKCLVALTESPSYTLTKWCSDDILRKGLVHEMKQSGYHSPAVWKSILFQICHIFAVLQKHHLLILPLSIDNFFIKESTEKHKTTWLYKINGIDYYVPNYGYLVMFDSTYKDLNVDPSMIENDINTVKMAGKMFVNIYNKSNEYGDIEQRKFTTEIYNQFKNIIDTNRFGDKFKKNGGIIPTDTSQFIDELNTDGRPDIIDYFHTHFSDYLNFKTGTVVPDNEAIMSYSVSMKYQKGEVVAYEDSYEIYKYVIFKEYNKDNARKCKILYRQNDNIFEKCIGVDSLRKINKRHKSEQRSDGKVNHNNEVYSLNSS